MPNQAAVNIDVTIIEALPNSTFRVESEHGQIILADISSRMRLNHPMRPGVRVRVLLSPDDHTRGSIIYRYK